LTFGKVSGPQSHIFEIEKSLQLNVKTAHILKGAESYFRNMLARLLSECGVKIPPRVRIPLSPPLKTGKHEINFSCFFAFGFW